eukprot:Skav222569  [mRNA]  locus=scaffold791:192350:192874:- [translate_table: standard]
MDVQLLITQWEHACGMTTALLTEGHHCLLRIDRFAHHEGQIVKHRAQMKFEDTILLPFYTGTGQDVAYGAYEAVAAVAHLCERPWRGHYRAALRVHKDPPMWCMVDDGAPPQLLPALPKWFLQQTTLIWAVHNLDLAWPLLPITSEVTCPGETEHEPISAAHQLMRTIGNTHIG